MPRSGNRLVLGTSIRRHANYAETPLSNNGCCTDKTLRETAARVLNAAIARASDDTMLEGVLHALPPCTLRGRLLLPLVIVPSALQPAHLALLCAPCPAEKCCAQPGQCPPAWLRDWTGPAWAAICGSPAGPDCAGTPESFLRVDAERASRLADAARVVRRAYAQVAAQPRPAVVVRDAGPAGRSALMARARTEALRAAAVRAPPPKRGRTIPPRKP